MSIEILVDGSPMYGTAYSPEDGYVLHRAVIDAGLNKGGSATFIVPRENPRYSDFVALNTLVEVWRNDSLRWRGRALVPGRDLYGRKTVSCEGELCFFQDSVQRPRTLTGTPTAVFTEIVSAHNSAVEAWKQFSVGTVSVTTDSDEITIALSVGEKSYATLQRLISNYGGYIIFDSLPSGARRVNWFAEPPYSCNQQIKLGYNLLDFSSSGDVSQYATRIIPYGAQNEDGTRVQIDIDGKDYVENAAAVAARGVIEMPVVYDGVTEPEELITLAERDLDVKCVLPETLRLSAVDMSLQDLTLDAFQVGQKVTATSEYHDMSGQYHLTALSEDLLDPSGGSVTLTRDAQYTDSASGTLTGTITGKDQENKQQFSSYVTMVGVITQRILGARGGAVRLLDTDGDELPDTLYIADNADPELAEKVWRFNYEGWGASKTGFNGPFVMGATLEDGLLASAVTAATLVAGTIQSADGTSFLLDLDNGIIEAESLCLKISGKTFSEYDQQTQEQIAQLDVRADGIESTVSTEIDNVKSEMTEIKQSSEDVSIRVQKIESDGVDKVTTAMGYTFDDNGLHIQKDGEEMENTLDNTGMYVSRSGEVILQADADGVEATDLKARNYLIIGNYSRLEDYNNGSDSKRTGLFWIGGDA